jgi:hypothetical protein
MKQFITIAALSILMATTALAQTTTPNPLHKQAVPKQTTEVAATAAEPPASAKPKRERSTKQLQSDQDMRTCGTNWRDGKDALKAKGETWRSYLKTCRAQLKTTRGA